MGSESNSGSRLPLKRCLPVVALFLATPATAHAWVQRAPCDSLRTARLPALARRASPDSNPTLVVLLTGDGGWAHADERVAQGLLVHGADVVGLNMRAYLRRKRNPDEAAQDVGCLSRSYLARWNRDRLLLLGYSRGADVAPFIAARLPADLRERVNMVALVSPGRQANFQFHLIDLVRDVSRPDDVPVAPELERLRGLRILCVYGREDRDSLCRDVDTTFVSRVERDGGHRITGGYGVVAGVLEAGLHPPAAGGG